MKKLLLLSALIVSVSSIGQTADEYFELGLLKIENLEDYQGAIADYTKAIEIDPDYVAAYVNRGVSKENLGDLVGACADWNKAAALGDTEAAQWVANQCN